MTTKNLPWPANISCAGVSKEKQIPEGLVGGETSEKTIPEKNHRTVSLAHLR